MLIKSSFNKYFATLQYCKVCALLQRVRPARPVRSARSLLNRYDLSNKSIPASLKLVKDKFCRIFLRINFAEIFALWYSKRESVCADAYQKQKKEAAKNSYKR